MTTPAKPRRNAWTFLQEATGVRAEHVGRYSAGPVRAVREHRALRGRRAGADRDSGPAARRRRARAGRVLCADGDDRRNTGRELQPGHEAAARRRRRQGDGHGRRHAARPGLRLRLGARSPRVRRMGQGALRRHQTAGRDEHPQSAGCTTSSSTPRAGSCSCDSTTRPGTPPGRTSPAGPPGRRAAGSGRNYSGRQAVPPRVQSGHRQEELADQHPAHPRQARHRRGDDPSGTGQRADAHQTRSGCIRPARSPTSAASCPA